MHNHIQRWNTYDERCHGIRQGSEKMIFPEDALPPASILPSGLCTPSKAKKMIEHLKFNDISRPEHKTKRYEVVSTHDASHLGYIAWDTGWRRYLMFFETDCKWSSDCIDQLNNFIKKLGIKNITPHKKRVFFL